MDEKAFDEKALDEKALDEKALVKKLCARTVHRNLAESEKENRVSKWSRYVTADRQIRSSRTDLVK